MPKNLQKFRDYDYDDDYQERRHQRDDLENRRRIKRMKNAIKTRNLDPNSDADEVY